MSLKTFYLSEFEPTIFCFVGGDDAHYTTPPGLLSNLLARIKKRTVLVICTPIKPLHRIIYVYLTKMCAHIVVVVVDDGDNDDDDAVTAVTRF
jgi:hypothetical protein